MIKFCGEETKVFGKDRTQKGVHLQEVREYTERTVLEGR